MKKSFVVLFLLVLTLHASSQTTAAYTQILVRFEQWKTGAIKAGTYASPGNCKMEIVTKEGYKGPVAGIPKELSIHYADINADGKLDALISFRPVQCDGGNAMMNVQHKLLILSKGSGWTADDKYISTIESKKDGWLSVNGVAEGTIFGTYFEYGPDDGRCCPSIKKPFTIDYKTKQLMIED